MKIKNLSMFVITLIFLSETCNVFSQFPPETQLKLNKVPIGIPKPSYLRSIIDSVFGTTITCISDEKVFGPTQVGPEDWWSPYRRHRWFKMQPWNADGTRILIDLTYPKYLVDGNTYKFIRRFDPDKPENNPPKEAVWSNIDPDIIYGITVNAFIKFSVSNDTGITMHLFNNYDEISLGQYEGNISNDDKYAALWCRKGDKYYTVVYDIKNDVVENTFDMGVWGANDYQTGINWVSISQTGKYVAILWQRPGKERYMGLELFDNKMNFIRQVYDDVSNGSVIELGLDAKGKDLAVYQDQLTMDIMTHRFSDGKVIKVLSGSKVSKSTTISCRNLQRPGWAYLGDFEAGDEAINTNWSRGKSDSSKASYNTVFALKLDGTETVEIFGHEHHSKNGGLYFQPMPVPDRTGKKVLFASDWENADMSVTRIGGPFKVARVYTYVAEYIVPSIPASSKK